ncbi:MAG: DNA topoisomerase 3 [Opitutales bacterium]|nr:DNA topoisomerase 3 [Opitutales bacterium]
MASKKSVSPKQLVIAEKPSVARDLAKALGGFQQNKAGYFEREDLIITSALGHLVELYMPGDFDAKYRYWSLKNLPILPEKFLLKPIEKTADRFEFLKKLMARKEVVGLINACDAGREGELIFAYLCELAGCEKPKQRLWLSSMTAHAIREAFEHLRTSESMKPLEDAARCRSEADWLVGINGTRAVTGRMMGSKRKEVASVGRVQTPTLALLCEREQAIRTFQPVPFWRLQGTFQVQNGSYTGWLQRENFKKAKEEDRADRFWNEEEISTLLTQLQRLKNYAWCVKDTTKTSKMAAPRLFDLTSLQRECNQRFGFPAKMTLDLVQSLYEKHKALTYPRTDARALPEDYGPTCIATLKKLGEPYASFANKIVENQWVNPHAKAIFNNHAISDHFAIIPTGILPKALKEVEAKVYDCVVRRFLAVFFPPAVFAVTTRWTTQAHCTFKTEGKVLVQAGWLEVVKRTESKDRLPALEAADHDSAQGLFFQLEAEETHPPARFTEATLLASMEHAGQYVEEEALADAMKERGLGTPATRAQIIENLITSKYVERHEKELIPTAKAEQLLAFLKAVQVEELSSPALTGEWEYRLNRIQNGAFSRVQFMEEIKTMASRLVEKIAQFKEESMTGTLTDVLSPSDGKPMMETFRSFQSQDGKIIIYKVIGNRAFQLEEMRQLLQQKQVGPLQGFVSKAGKTYSASLVMDENFKVKFDFGEGKPIATVDVSQAPEVGTCPLCHGKVYVTESMFLCERAQGSSKEKRCSFRIMRTLLGVTLSDQHVQTLLQDGKTSLIDGFISKRNGKHFSAYLVLKKNGTIGFEFPPREKKTKTEVRKHSET